MRPYVVNKLLKYIKSNSEKDVLFGLREIVKRIITLSPNNLKEFRLLGIVPLVLALIPTENEQLVDYVCIILRHAIDHSSIQQVLTSGKLSFLFNYIERDDIPKEILCHLCSFITSMGTNHPNVRELIYSSEIPRKVLALMVIHEIDSQVLIALIKILGGLLQRKSDAEVLLREECLLSICKYAFDASVETEFLNICIKIMSKALCLDSSLMSVSQISAGTKKFTLLYNQMNRADHTDDVIIDIVNKVVDTSQLDFHNNSLKCKQEESLEDIILANIPKALVSIVNSSCKHIKKKAFQLLMKFLRMKLLIFYRNHDRCFATHVKLWTQLRQNNICKVLITLLSSSNDDIGPVNYIRSEILTSLLTFTSIYVQKEVSCQLIENNYMSMFVSLFRYYATFLLDMKNVPKDSPNNMKNCSHVSFNSMDNCREKGDFAAFYECLNIMVMLLRLLDMVIQPNNDCIKILCLGHIDELLLKLILEGSYLHEHFFKLVIMCLNSQYESSQYIPQTILSTTTLFQLILINTSNSNDCYSCSQIESGRRQLLSNVQKLFYFNSVIKQCENREEKNILPYINFPLISSTMDQVYRLNCKYEFVEKLLEYIKGDDNYLYKEYAFRSLFILNNALKATELENTDCCEVPEVNQISHYYCNLYNDKSYFLRACFESFKQLNDIFNEPQDDNIYYHCKLREIETDMTFEIQDRTIAVNRDYISSKNPIFAKMLKGYFKEANHNPVKLTTTYYRSFYVLIHHVHDCECFIINKDKLNVAEILELLYLTDMYNVPELLFYPLYLMKSSLSLNETNFMDVITVIELLFTDDMYTVFLTLFFVNTEMADFTHWVNLLRNSSRRFECLIRGLENWMRVKYLIQGKGNCSAECLTSKESFGAFLCSDRSTAKYRTKYFTLKHIINLF